MVFSLHSQKVKNQSDTKNKNQFVYVKLSWTLTVAISFAIEIACLICFIWNLSKSFSIKINSIQSCSSDFLKFLCEFKKLELEVDSFLGSFNLRFLLWRTGHQVEAAFRPNPFDEFQASNYQSQFQNIWCWNVWWDKAA